MLSTPDSVTFELEATSGGGVSVEVRFRRDTVDVRCDGHLKAVFGRDELAAWFAKPEGVLRMDNVALALHNGPVRVWIDPVVQWRPLSTLVLMELMGRI